MTEEMKTTQERRDDLEEIRKSRKLYLISFNVAFPTSLLARIITECLPEDCKIVGCDRDFMHGMNHFCIWSEEFRETEQSQALPQLTINVTVNEKRDIERVFLTEYNYETKKTEERSWRSPSPVAGTPECFKTDPSPQAQAENDCPSCDVNKECL